ncbi:MAG: hypothetical protein HQ561_17450 [Desulfobacteraceae bacterium]|nr:hypothetical protein [Desulfobacteraceae bacterium]
MTQILLNPRGVSHREENPIATRPDYLDDKVLGLVDNSKTNADVFLDRLQELMIKTYRIKEVLRIRKSVAGTPAPFNDDFFEKCDMVVNAFGD